MSLVAVGRSTAGGAGHAAVWVSLYVGGCTVCLADIAGSDRRWAVIATAVLVALSIYIIDRVKLSDARHDPADRLAHPGRFEFVSRHAGLLRTVALLSGIGALVLAASLHWFALPACLAGYVGVLLYAGGGSRHAPHRPRIKDRLLVKNVYVAAGITGLCALLVAAGSHVRWRELGLGAAVLLLIVLGDSVLCDIPDAESDARFGTHTVPNVFGAAAAWVIALVCHLGSVAIVVTRLGIADTSWSGLVLPAAIAATTAMLMAIRPTHLRDIVDARLGAFGVIALVAG